MAGPTSSAASAAWQEAAGRASIIIGTAGQRAVVVESRAAPAPEPFMWSHFFSSRGSVLTAQERLQLSGVEWSGLYCNWFITGEVGSTVGSLQVGPDGRFGFSAVWVNLSRILDPICLCLDFNSWCF